MKLIMVRRLIFVLALGANALYSQHRREACNIDFRNFTFPFPPTAFLGVPDGMKWMANVTTSVTLVNGRHDFDTNGPSRGTSVILDEVRYGYLTMSGQLDAMVMLSYHTGGTAYWNYVYAGRPSFKVCFTSSAVSGSDAPTEWYIRTRGIDVGSMYRSRYSLRNSSFR
jgi:hypothetical protein